MKVFEASEKIILYLKSRQILPAYKKAKDYINAGNYQEVNLKKREPKSSNIYQFRITKKYRAFAIKEGDRLVVFKISDHQ